MKIRNTEDVLQYPETYEFLSEEQQTIIVNYMNAVQDLAHRYYETHLEYEADKYLEKYQKDKASVRLFRERMAIYDKIQVISQKS